MPDHLFGQFQKTLWHADLIRAGCYWQRVCGKQAAIAVPFQLIGRDAVRDRNARRLTPSRKGAARG